MWESMTYNNILNDMLNGIASDVDKREGSVIYDALAPCAYKLAEAYFYLDAFLDLVSGDTAVGEYLDKVVADYGITRKSAIKAIRKITTSKTVDIGTRWGISGLVYTITGAIATNQYVAECNKSGAIGNQYTGALENVDNVSGVTAMLTDILTAGEDEETDDNLRERFYSQVRSAGTSGNKYDYRNWALDVPGCGDAKVFPLWNGSGTVKVLVVDENMIIDPDLPAKVAEYIETVRPIGAIVTVTSPAGLTINVSANIILDGTKSLAEVQTAFKDILTTYFIDTVFEIYSVSYAKIGSLLLLTPGVKDYDTLLINGGISNITIGQEEMPICGTVVISEVS